MRSCWAVQWYLFTGLAGVRPSRYVVAACCLAAGVVLARGVVMGSWRARSNEQKSMDPRSRCGLKCSRAGQSSRWLVTITLENALKVATMFACLRVWSQGRGPGAAESVS